MPAEWGNISIQELCDAVGGTLLLGDPGCVLKGLSTDSRTIRAGEVFWALKGERHDGHRFVQAAAHKGASCVVVERGAAGDPAKDAPCAVIAVRETLRALGRLASWWRSRHETVVIAVTGTSGKTTTKEMTAGILEIGSETFRNPGNFNNLIGLPLSLLQLRKSHARAVLEMGMNRPGEIARLTEISDPEVGLITNVGKAHLEGVGGLEGVAAAKVELLRGMRPKGKAVLNGDDERLMRVASAVPHRGLTFGLGKGNDVRAAGIQSHGAEGVVFDILHREMRLPVELRVPGIQNVVNALGAAAAAFCLEEPPDHVAEGLGKFRGLKGRFMAIRLSGGGVLIDDTYNSNPSSLKSALESLKGLGNPGSGYIIALGDMKELGGAASPEHLKAGERVARIDPRLFLALGEHAPEMVRGALEAGMARERAREVMDHADMVRSISTEYREGDVILLKGSRKMELDRVMEEVRSELS